MRISKIRLQNFRGYDSAHLRLDGHVVVVGEPRAGRSDLVRAIRRVLDHRSTRGRVDPLDIHQPLSDPPTRTEVELTLLDLGASLEQLLSDYLELFDSTTGELAEKGTGAVFGLRLCYRANYDFDSDTGDHWVDYPSKSDPGNNSFRRVPRQDREALPVYFLEDAPPLQVRAEGRFRTLAEDRNAADLSVALAQLDSDVVDATAAFAASSAVSDTLGQVQDAGFAEIMGPSTIAFAQDDGTLASLLRAVQPTVELDSAGQLPAGSHGSTTLAVLNAAEGVAAAREAGEGLILIADDFGDRLDAPSAEQMAYLVRRASSQAVITTRRPEVVRAFHAGEVLRLTRSHGSRLQHRLPAADRAGRVVRRLALDQLLAAMTSRTVALVEGPLDAEGYGALASRLAHSKKPPFPSLAAQGIRFVAPPGSDGGVSRLKGMAELASAFGFHVRAIVDGDKPGANDAAIADLLRVAEQVVVLPDRTSVEAALVRGVSGDKLRAATDALEEAGALSIPADVDDDALADHLIRSKALKKHGLHTEWVYSLTGRPPIATAALKALASDDLGLREIDDV